MKAYYDARAREYDEWYEGLGRFDGLGRPRWDEEVRELERVVASLPRARTLDVACGTAFLTRHLQGEVVGLEQSESMLAIAAERVPAGEFVQGDALALPSRTARSIASSRATSTGIWSPAFARLSCWRRGGSRGSSSSSTRR